LIGPCHHIGTTRMHGDPKLGVVNADCQVHGISNLYIAGSSVFPTSGTAAPTLTIVALALRLADHIKHILKNMI
jgi:choline dehydrogenase-like flavoprotein